jgi:hypothetical protein
MGLLTVPLAVFLIKGAIRELKLMVAVIMARPTFGKRE